MTRSVRRLAFVSDGPHFGGAERYVLDMAEAARRRGIEADVWWIAGRGGEGEKGIGGEGEMERWRDGEMERLRIADCELRIERPALNPQFAIRNSQLRRLLRERRPDALIVNASGRAGFWRVPLLARWAGVPAAWVHHMVDTRDHRRLAARRMRGRMEGLGCWRWPQTLRHRLAAAAAAIVVTSNDRDAAHVARWFGTPHAKLRVIPPGVDATRFTFDPAARARWRNEWGVTRESDGSTFVIGSAGRLVAGKRMERLIEATAELHRLGVRAKTVIAGDGPARDKLAALAAQIGVADDVRFVGFIDDVPGFLSSLDAFVLCSEVESFGLALAEAMACERCVVATATPGACRQIEHGRTGYLLAADSPRALAGLLRRLSVDPEIRRNVGHAARRSVVERFSIDQTLSATLDALQWEESRTEGRRDSGTRGRSDCATARSRCPAVSPSLRQGGQFA